MAALRWAAEKIWPISHKYSRTLINVESKFKGELTILSSFREREFGPKRESTPK